MCHHAKICDVCMLYVPFQTQMPETFAMTVPSSQASSSSPGSVRRRSTFVLPAALLAALATASPAWQAGAAMTDLPPVTAVSKTQQTVNCHTVKGHVVLLNIQMVALNSMALCKLFLELRQSTSSCTLESKNRGKALLA